MILVLAFLSDWHVVLLFLLIVLLFGGKKLPELARGLGEAMKEFKKAQRDAHDEIPKVQPPQPTPPPQNPNQPKQT